VSNTRDDELRANAVGQVFFQMSFVQVHACGVADKKFSKVPDVAMTGCVTAEGAAAISGTKPSGGSIGGGAGRESANGEAAEQEKASKAGIKRH
jgi:hypothetical protein